jgi:purine-binding chemotaxis protein CheW
MADRALKLRDWVTFRLGRQIYALPIEPVVRIIEMVAITPLPQVNGVVEGVINLRGKSVPVINLRRLFGLPLEPFRLRTPIILVQIGAQTFGLVVDEVIDVLSLTPGQIATMKEIMPEGVGETLVLYGLVHVQNDTVLLLDLDHMLSPGQMRALAQVVNALPVDPGEGKKEGEKESKGKGKRRTRKAAAATKDAGAAGDVLVEEVTG